MRTFFVMCLGLVLILGAGSFIGSCSYQTSVGSISSPNGSVKVHFDIDSVGQPFYKVQFNGQSIILRSDLGFQLADGENLSSHFKMVDCQVNSFDEVWEAFWGPSQYVRNNYNEAVYTLKNKAGLLKVVFRVYDSGLGFRYEVERANKQPIIITEEKTAFKLPADSKCWWIPADDDSYEKIYQQTLVSGIDSVQTPLTLITPDSTYLSIHEAALVNFPSMTIRNSGNGYLQSRLVPDTIGHVYKGDNTLISPWRTIQLGKQAVDLINSDLIVNLNEEAQGDFSWVKPMKYTGIWWEMHLGLKTWHGGERHGATTARAKEMIDFAAANGIQGLLVEGWNIGWDEWKDFDYCRSYDDYNLEEVVSYARQNGVEIVMHNETAGYVNEYEQQIPKAFDYYQKLGIKYIKTGYVGPVKSGEPHHGQRMVKHYQYVLEEAAKRGICILGHEHIKPTGLNRTWPNLLAVESARGQEYNAPWAPQNNAPEHVAILPYTRLLAGSMDYTPGLFRLTYEHLGITDKRAYSTLAQQLALYVVCHSPAQMACDLPENYVGHPAFEFIKKVPVSWSRSLALDGEIGEFLVMARKARNSDCWYLGAITDDKKRTVTIDCSFLNADIDYKCVIYRDTNQSDYLSEPHEFLIEEIAVNASTKMEVRLARGGGAAIEFIPDFSQRGALEE